MPITIKPTRYAHPEGHTGVCYFTGEKGGLLTCGADGDVRYWLNLMDDDPSATCIAEQATAVVSKNGKLYVGNDNNTIQILTFPDLEKEGIVTRFSAAVSALATTKNSKFIVSGACDMRIQVTNIETSQTIELCGHEAPILGLSLDPKEEYVASSSADGSIRIWKISEKKCVHTWNNVVPKCNSFFTAKSYSTPSFSCNDGSVLAYPHGKEIVIVERNTWKENNRLKCSDLRTELSICKFSECGTRLAATSIHGEIVVWDVESGKTIGYVEHHQNPKITTIAWHLDKPNELAFCDSLGQLGCVDIISGDKSLDDLISEFPSGNDVEDDLEIGGDNYLNGADDEDDNENAISLNKIKNAAARLGDDDAKSHSDIDSDFVRAETRAAIPEINLQAPFQPGSSPVHLLSRFMVWNDTGIVKCYTTEDEEDSSIEVEFHDATIHHTMHMNNYLRHTMAALSPQALALSCPSVDGTPSKLVVVVLQGWGSGNKEWSVDLPEGEESLCLATGDTFVAVATSRRNLRLFMIGGIQREIIALPGSPVAMNGYGSNLVVAYHTGVGTSNDQHMNIMWIRIRGPDLRSQTLSLPLAPSCELMWIGLTDLASPIVMDEEGLVKVYDKKSSLWRVAVDTDKQCKGKMDHFFIIGVSEKERNIRCVLCKGSRYPPTTPRPTVNEIPMILPLCEPESEKTAKETQLWQVGSHPLDENEAVLALIAFACRGNVEFRAVELCEQIASDKVIELAIKYAGRINRMALANKFESIADKKDQQRDENTAPDEVEIEFDSHNDDIQIIDTQEDIMLTPVAKKKPEVEIKPLTLSGKRHNPFAKGGPSVTSKGLSSLNTMPEKPQKPKTSTLPPSSKPQQQRKNNENKKDSFVVWLSKNKADLQEEFPDLSALEFSKAALKRYKEDANVDDGKKRKLSSPESQETQVKRSAPNKLIDFLYDK